MDLDTLKGWTLDSIESELRMVLDNFVLSDKTTKLILEKLEYYKWVKTTADLHNGSHIRYLQLNEAGVNDEANSHTALHSGIFCKINDKGQLVCRNIGSGRFFQLNFENYAVFQRFTPEEQTMIEYAEYIYG